MQLKCIDGPAKDKIVEINDTCRIGECIGIHVTDIELTKEDFSKSPYEDLNKDISIKRIMYMVAGDPQGVKFLRLIFDVKESSMVETCPCK